MRGVGRAGRRHDAPIGSLLSRKAVEISVCVYLNILTPRVRLGWPPLNSAFAVSPHVFGSLTLSVNGCVRVHVTVGRVSPC